MAEFPPLSSIMPPHIKAMLVDGKYGQALREGGKVVAREVGKKGPAIVEPIYKSAAVVLQQHGCMAEAAELTIIGEELIIVGEGVGGGLSLSEGAELIMLSQRLATGWTAALSTGAVLAEAALPLTLFCLLVGFAYLVSQMQNPGAARSAAKQEVADAKKNLCYCSRNPVGVGAGGRVAYAPVALPTGGSCSFPLCKMGKAA